MKSTLQDEIGSRARDLSKRGIECVLEKFRLPASPRLTPPAAWFAGAAAAFLLSRGHGAAAFLLATAGSILLLLDDRGFSPLDWLGRKESRSVLVVRGAPTDGEQKALFFCIPVACRLTKDGVFSGVESARRALHAAGFLLSAALCVVSAGMLLQLWSAPPLPAAVAGAALLAVFVLETVPRSRPGAVRNLAAGWMEHLSQPAEDGRRPFLLLYSGDPEEVKYFLARHRGDLIRGAGVFLEFSPSAAGPPAVSVREGPIFPVRVDPGMLDRVRSSGAECGVPPLREAILRYKSPGLFAMARGFRAVTLFRGEAPPGGETAYTEGEAKQWANGILSRIVSREPRERNRSPDSPAETIDRDHL